MKFGDFMRTRRQQHSSPFIGIHSVCAIRCGVLFICSRATPNAYLQINESAPHFLFTHMPHRSRYGTKNNPNKMKIEKYVAPEAEVLEIAVEQGFAQSQLESPEEGEED